MGFDWPRRSGERLATGVPAALPAAEFRRLGKPGAYRLGLLRAQGVPERRRPMQFRARIARRRDHRWPVWVWSAGLLASAAIMAVGTAAGWWFVPLLAGLAAGAANQQGGWPPRVVVPAVAAAAAAGWLLPFLLGSVRDSTGGALARAAGTLTGLPAHAAAVAALTMVAAVVQALAGYCCARAFTPRLVDDQIRRG